MSSIVKSIRTIILAIGIILLLGILGLFALPMFVSPDTIREQAQTTLSAATGRTISIAGPIDVHFFPNVSVVLEGLSVSHKGGINDKNPALHIQKADMKLKLMPLFSGTAEFNDIDITGLTLYTMNKASGQNISTLACDITAKGYAHYDIAQGFAPDTIKRTLLSETALNMTNIVLLDKDLIASLAKTFGGSGWEQFDSASATIITKDGTVHSDNINVTGKKLNAMGKASANLISEALAGKFDVSINGIGSIPVEIKGTINKPVYTIETASAVNILMKGLEGLGLTSTSTGSASSTEQTSESTDSKTSSQKALEGLGNLLNSISK